MADLLVKLYELPDVHPLVTALHAQGVEVRQPFPTEKHHLSTWVLRHFSESWAAGIELAVGTWPARCYIAVRRTRQQPPGDDPYDLPTEELLGFGCYDVSARGMFGPLGVREDWRGRGIGRALLVSCLHAMRVEGYAYAVIGWAGPVDFYTRAVGAMEIPGSAPGVYRGRLIDQDGV